jgi:hypothetical protein
MKKSNKRGHLHLSTEAVRTLTTHQLDAVAGGFSGPTCQTCNTCNKFLTCKQ